MLSAADIAHTASRLHGTIVRTVEAVRLPPNGASRQGLFPASRRRVAAGLDELTNGGIPRGRATLVSRGAGSGKTLLGLEFLVHGARALGEPGVLISFEESATETATNVASLGVDLPGLEAEGALATDAFRIDATTIVRTGSSTSRRGRFIRLGLAVESVDAKGVVLDTVEVLFTALGNESIVRAELSRPLRLLMDRGYRLTPLTAVLPRARLDHGQAGPRQL